MSGGCSISSTNSRSAEPYSLMPHRQRHPPRVVLAAMISNASVAGIVIAMKRIGFRGMNKRPETRIRTK